MIRIRPERFPSGTVKKLQARSAGQFKVMKRMGPNAYVIDLPHDYGISSSFNIEDLLAYKSPIAIPDTPFDESLPNPIDTPIPTPSPLNLPYAHKESIDAILDEIRQLDFDLLEYYQSSSNFHSTGSSSSHPRGVGANTRYKSPIIRTYRRKSKKKTAQPVAL